MEEHLKPKPGETVAVCEHYNYAGEGPQPTGRVYYHRSLHSKIELHDGTFLSAQFAVMCSSCTKNPDMTKLKRAMYGGSIGSVNKN